MSTQEVFVGSDCTGSDSDTDRTLTISNTTKTDNNNFKVFVDNSFLHLNEDYTVVHNTNSSVITFLNAVWDAQDISVIYDTKISTLSTGASGILPLDTQYINNELNHYGDTVVVRAVTKLDEDNRGNSQLVYGDSKIAYTSADDALESFYGATWVAQTFTTVESINATSINLKIKRTGTPGAITVSIRAVDAEFKPTGSDLSSGTLDYVDLIDDGDTEWASIPLTDYTLSATTMYAIVIRTASGDSVNKYEARNKTVGTYAGGTSVTSSDSGVSWTLGTSDLLFEVFGDTTATAMVDILGMEDDAVKSGMFKSGDLRLNFQNAESNIARGNMVKYRDNWYEIDSVELDSMGDVSYFSEAIAKKI